MSTKLSHSDILKQFSDSVSGATDEILELAEEAKHNEFGAQSFLDFVADEPVNRETAENYIFEILKAYGCCSQNIVADDQHSKKILKTLELQNPQLLWVKQAYKESVFLEDIHPELKEDKQLYLLSQERLEQWLS